jgi:hypothetical protein
MSFASDLLPGLDAVRAIPGELGLRDVTVTQVVRTWTGARVGLGTATRTDTAVLVGGQNPRVERISPREVVASAGRYQAGDLRVTVTPEFPGGGVARSVLQPAVGASPTELYWLVTGRGFPADGMLCTKVGPEEHDELRITFVIRQTSAKL